MAKYYLYVFSPILCTFAWTCVNIGFSSVEDTGHIGIQSNPHLFAATQIFNFTAFKNQGRKFWKKMLFSVSPLNYSLSSKQTEIQSHQ